MLRAEVRAGRLDGEAVNAVLKAAGHRAPARREWPAGLTAREIEVLALLARGHSNREIARRLDAFAGDLGGPLADLAGLFGEVMDVKRAPITHQTVHGKGTLTIGDFVSGEMEPYKSPDGQSITTLRDSLFAVGIANLLWMAALATLMAYEKTGRHGIQAGHVAGVALLLVAAAAFTNPPWLASFVGS